MDTSKYTGPVRWFVSASALARGKKILDVVPCEGFTVPEGAPAAWFYTGPCRHFGHFPPKKGRGRKD
jgi:hypothetical protein